MEQLPKTQVLQLIVQYVERPWLTNKVNCKNTVSKNWPVQWPSASVFLHHLNHLQGTVHPEKGLTSSRLAELLFHATAVDSSEDEVMEMENQDSDEEQGLEIVLGQKYEVKQPPHWTVLYTANHKSACRTAQFSPDGRLVATGSLDTTIKVLDTAKLRAIKNDQEERPVLKTLYDNTAAITDISWHPILEGLVSGSEDKTIKYFDIQSTNTRKAVKSFQDAHPVRSVHFHPSGEFVVSASDHEAPRIWDFQTGKCYVSAKEQWHRSSVTCTRFSPKGNVYLSTSIDGSIKIWDAVTGKCIQTLDQAHASYPVWQVIWSKNARYFFSSGGDGTLKCWDMSTKQVVQVFDGVLQSQPGFGLALNNTEEYIFTGDEKVNQVSCWDIKSGKLVKTLGGTSVFQLANVLAHNQTVRGVACSPTESMVTTCSEDARAKFWIE
jgi:cleavage stimulation factor subunit 1